MIIVDQPVIIIVAFFVVQWHVGILVKLLVVVLGSSGISLALYEYWNRRSTLLRSLFGMTTRRVEWAQVSMK